MDTLRAETAHTASPEGRKPEGGGNRRPDAPVKNAFVTRFL
jgi:hypothetical protein